MTSKESIKSVLSYNRLRKDDPICSDKELESKLKAIDKELDRLLRHVDKLQSQSRREMRKDRLKKEQESQTNP